MSGGTDIQQAGWNSPLSCWCLSTSTDFILDRKSSLSSVRGEVRPVQQCLVIGPRCRGALDAFDRISLSGIMMPVRGTVQAGSTLAFDNSREKSVNKQDSIVSILSV